MNPLEKKIVSFAKDPEVILETLALINVGRNKGDCVEEVMSRIIANLLMRFHGIPIKPGNSN